MSDNNKIRGFFGGRRKSPITLNLIKNIFKKASKESVDPIKCPNCENNFFVVAAPGDGWPRSRFYSDGKETIGLLVRSEAWYKDFMEEPLPEDSCDWHE